MKWFKLKCLEWITRFEERFIKNEKMENKLLKLADGIIKQK
jgi:hypothetical protein